MSLRDAVETLRRLKVELEASHRAKGELEAAYLRVAEELRVAKEQGAGSTRISAEVVEEGKPATTQGAESSIDNDHGSRARDAERDEREERLRQELLQAQSALEDSVTERTKLAQNVKSLRERLTEVKLEAQVAEKDIRHELQEVLAAKDVAVEGEKSSLRRVALVTSEAAKEAARAAEAEDKLSRAVEDAATLNGRLEGVTKELEDLRSWKKDCQARLSEEGGEGASYSDMAALKTELQSIREAMDQSGGDVDKPEPQQEIGDVMTTSNDDETRRQVEKLRSELERVVAENLELVEMVESTERDVSRAALATESAMKDVASKEEALALKEKEVERLGLRLTAAEEERDEAKRLASAELQQRDAEEASASSRYAEELEAVRSELLSLRESLAEALQGREDVERRAAADKARSQDEIASLRSNFEELVDQKDAELAAKRVEVDEKQAEVAEKQAEIAEKVAIMTTEREEAKAAATTAVAAAIVETTTAEQVNAERVWRTTVASLREEIRNAEREREVLRQALAEEKQGNESEVSEIEEELQRMLREKESAENAAKQSDDRAIEAEEEAKRHKSEAKKMEQGRVAAEEAQRAAEQERDLSAEEVEKARAVKQEMEDTLLIANEELQRIRHKCEEAESKRDSLHAESERLARDLESLHASVEADASKAKSAAAATSEEIARLKDRVQELEEMEVQYLRNTTRDDLAANEPKDAVGKDEDGHDKEVGGEAEDGDQMEKELVSEAHQALIEERDRLQEELRKSHQSAAERTAALETQLGDAEREAADTQRRLYRQQAQLEAELEELRASHDGLRVEIARMDAAMQDAADAADRSRTAVDGTALRNGGANEVGRGKRDPAEIGAELGGAVGGILRGKFWTGWGGASASESNNDIGVGTGDVRDMQDLRGVRVANAARTKGKQVGFRLEGQSRDSGVVSARVGAGIDRDKRARRGGGAWTADSELDDSVYDRRQQLADKDDLGPCLCWPLSSASVTRVRHTMMTKLQEAASQPMMDRSSADEDQIVEQGSKGEHNARRPITDVPVEESPTSLPEDDGEQGAFVGQLNTPERRRSEGGKQRDEAGPGDEDGWVEETVEHPPPGYGMDSPVIRHLLKQWSSDPEKLKYLTLWLRYVIEGRKVPDAFPSGLQLVGLATEVKDGLLTLVVPMIRHTARVPVLVHSRVCLPGDEEEDSGHGDRDDRDEDKRWDLRIKVDLQSAGKGSAPGAAVASGLETSDSSRQSQDGRRRPRGEGGELGVGGSLNGRGNRGRVRDGAVDGVEPDRSGRQRGFRG